MPPTVAAAVLPARSDTVPERERFVPSLLMTCGVGPQLPIPDNASVQVKTMLTFALYQLLAFGARSAAPAMVGAVLSMLMPLTTDVASLPARSRPIPVRDWFAASVL